MGFFYRNGILLFHQSITYVVSQVRKRVTWWDENYKIVFKGMIYVKGCSPCQQYELEIIHLLHSLPFQEQKWVKRNCGIFALMFLSNLLVHDSYVSGNIIKETLMYKPYHISHGNRFS